MVANIFISQLSLMYWCNYKFAWMRNKRFTLHTWKAQVDQLSLPLNMDYGSSLLILMKSIMVRREAESPKCLATSPSLDKGSYETTGLFLPRVFWSFFFYLEKYSLHRCPKFQPWLEWLYLYWAKRLFWSSCFRNIRMDFPKVRGRRQTTSVIVSLPKSDDVDGEQEPGRGLFATSKGSQHSEGTRSLHLWWRAPFAQHFPSVLLLHQWISSWRAHGPSGQLLDPTFRVCDSAI